MSKALKHQAKIGARPLIKYQTVEAAPVASGKPTFALAAMIRASIATASTPRGGGAGGYGGGVAPTPCTILALPEDCQ